MYCQLRDFFACLIFRHWVTFLKKQIEGKQWYTKDIGLPLPYLLGWAQQVNNDRHMDHHVLWSTLAWLICSPTMVTWWNNNTILPTSTGRKVQAPRESLVFCLLGQGVDQHNHGWGQQKHGCDEISQQADKSNSNEPANSPRQRSDG